MLSAEMQYSAKALMVKPGGGSTSDDAECVRMLTEVLRGFYGRTTLVVFSRLGAKILAEEAYVLDVCKRLDRKGNLPGSPISE